ncbi:unnamed protein product [Ranitomeya imitator]|uniref:Cytochrome b-c1 complex subunit 7 n=1 Tax=Ranitomeya imitator TaxID=111125 RepID=A0ABN9L9V7_9NEOB|nr:unnamed protein product [Ranitomeya imitator]
MEKSPTTQLKNRYQIFVEDEAIPASKKEKGTQQQVTAKSTAKKQRRVVVVGDSLLRGTEAAICRPDITAREVCCLPGAMIKDVTDRIPKLFSSKDVHPFLLIHVGTNDTARKDLPTICKDFEELGKKVKELDAQRRTTPQQTWETHIRQKTRYTHQEGVKLEEEGTGRKTLDLNKEDPGKHTQKGGKNISKTIHSEEIGTKQNPLNCMLANARSLTNKMEELEAEISTVQASGRFMESIRKWYYGLAGFNKIGLMRDDTLYETPDVQEAIRRLPAKVYDDRMFRIKRALDLDMKKNILPKEQWTKYEEDVSYLQPYIREVIRERKEKEEWGKK